MSRYIDADKLPRHGNRGGVVYWRDIEAQPTADVRENDRATLRADHGDYRCTNCNALISDEIDYVLEDYKPIQFCPNCGAQMMRGDKNMKKLIKGVIIIILAAILLTACRPAKAHAETVKRYATQTISLKDKAGGKTLLKVKRNTRLYQTREGRRWAVVKYKGNKYVTLKKYLNTESLTTRKGKRYYINYLKTRGPVHWRGRKYTYYTSRLCPIWLLPVPGLHLDKEGMWCDNKDYIVLGSSVSNKVNRKVIATPFGKYGKVYDTGGYSTPSWLCDTAVNW